ncbi:hypothetical protein Taro_027995 [Colocasia esculenta]|uniref:Adenine DNA glycosylase n=1 Tax=Colocasia esculenta TaxID=4460 RepID=A0A843VT02_COLES|nr:hypothetical protein [Colocasia esculenta]
MKIGRWGARIKNKYIKIFKNTFCYYSNAFVGMRACVVFHVRLPGGALTANSNSPALSPSMAAAGAADEKKRARPRRGRPAKKAQEGNGETAVAAAVASSVPDIEDFSPEAALKARASLLQWYDAKQRKLPWRTAASQAGGAGEDRAYAVWVSEVMLQQTQVATVVGYYNRWMERWPTVRHLASASQEEVNEMWAGLGYYRRARFLLEGAKSIVEAGEFPRSAAALRQVVPVVDGNVIRVISRLKAISANPKESATVKNIWRLAGQLVDPSRPGDFNQALMELGATLCNANQCQALSLSRKFDSIQVTTYPTKVTRAKKRHDFAAVCVLEVVEELDPKELKANSYPKVLVLVKRPEEGLLAGLWEFPSVLVEGEEQTDQATRRQAIDLYLKESFDLNLRANCHVIVREDVGKYVHIFSHIRLHMYVELLIISLKGGLDALQNKAEGSLTWKIVDDDSIEVMGLTSGVRKVYNMMKSFKHKKLSTLTKSALTKNIKRRR